MSRDWDPMRTMRDLMAWDPLQGTVSRFLRTNGMRMSYAPAIDMLETKDAFVFKADLPGFREQDIEVHVTGNRLTITGRREADDTNGSNTYHRMERTHGSFMRSFTLPSPVDADEIEADLQDGVLSMEVPKADEAHPKKISVRNARKRGKKESMS